MVGQRRLENDYRRKLGTDAFLSEVRGQKWLQLLQVPLDGGVCSCLIEPREEPIEDFVKHCYIAIEWHSEVIDKYYNPNVNVTMTNKPVENEIESQNVVSLASCLKDYFAKVKNYLRECPNCEDDTVHACEQKISKLPPILNIRLDRFQKWGSEGG